MHNEEKNILDNPISLSIIIASFIVAISVIVGAYMIRGGSFGSADTQGIQGAQAAKGGLIKVSDRANEPTIGNPKAPLTVYEFGDFQCPYCKQFYTVSYADIKAKYIDTGKVKLVFRHFPLTQIHVNAQISSEAAECASRQGRFEDYYNALYTKGQGDGGGLDSTSLKTYAAQLGLNTTQFNQCLDNHETAAVVTADTAEGTKDGITGTPSFIIKGQVVVGAQPTAVIEQAFDQALKK